MSVDGSDRDHSLGSAQLAYESIRQAIVEGRYRPGQRLIEQRIGEEFALSRTPIRESLRLLEAEGLVKSERNRGAVVRPVSAEDIVDLYELRARLESLAAERAAARATPEDVVELDEVVAEFEAAVSIVDESGLDGIRQLSAANTKFHQSLVRISNHQRLQQLLARTVDIPLVFQAFRQFTPAENERSNLFHHLIRDAVAVHDADRAGRLMTEHILQGRDTLLLRLDEHPSVDALFGDEPEESRRTVP